MDVIKKYHLKYLFTISALLIFCACSNIRNAENNRIDLKEYQGPIIDMHMHAYNAQNQLFGEAINPITGEVRRGSENPQMHMLETFQVMEDNDIVLAMVSSVDEDNNVLLKWREKKPERILIGQSIVNPKTIDIDSLRLKLINDEVDVLGEVMPNYAGILPTDPSLNAIFELAEEQNLPVGYHLFPGGPPGSPYFINPQIRAVQAKPLQMEEVLLSHPSVKVYIMHGGWPFLEDMKALMFVHQQVYIDLSVICWVLPRLEFHQYLKSLIEAGYSKRIMFGSDQMVWPKEIINGIEAINSAPFLTHAQKADIFYFNAAEFLGLSKEQIEYHHNISSHDNAYSK